MLSEYEGTIKKILFNENNFVIAILETKEDDIKIIGNLFGIKEKDKLNVKGNWEKHQKFGDQLKVIEWERPIPKSIDEAKEFLASGLIKGVGSARANQIVKALGDQAISIINKDGKKALIGIKGIGKKTASDIVESVKKNYEVQEVISQLKKYNITTNVILKLYKEYGTDTVRKIHQNPYRITEVSGMGFFKVDEIARSMGVSPYSGYRIGSCIQYTLNTLCHQKGHSFIYKDILVRSTLENLNYNISEINHVEKEELVQSIYNLEDKILVIEKDKVYPKRLFEYEDGLAQKLSILRGSRGGEAMPKIEKHIKKYQTENKVILANKQREAIKKLMTEQVMILTGGPGTGKTTVVKAMIDIYKKLNKKAVIRLCAPTGRASRKLEEATGHEAMTIHRLIGYRQGESPQYHANNRLSGDLIIVDEFSMADLEISYLLMNALNRNAKVLFIGDVDQLPSVGVGNVLKDLINSSIPTVRLTDVFRQAEKSQIVTNAHRINNGKSLLIDSDKDDFYFIGQSNLLNIQELIIRSACRFIELGYSLEDLLILSPMHKGEVGVSILNEKLRETLNPPSADKKELQLGKRFFREGDKVLQNINNVDKDVFNGEIGIVKSITREKGKNDILVDIMICEFDEKLVKYERKDCVQLDLGYSITIHKSQGGEAPIVIMPITTSHQIMLARNLYYTGITRAQEKVVLIGTDQAMNIAIQNDQVAKRNSQLDKRIINRFEQLREALGTS